MNATQKVASTFLKLTQGLHWKMSKMLLASFLLCGGIFYFVTPVFRSPDEPEHWKAAVFRAHVQESSADEVCTIELSLFKFLQTEILISRLDRVIQPGNFRNLPSMTPTCADHFDAWYGNQGTYFGYSLSKFLISDLVPSAKKLTSFDRAVLRYLLARFLQGLMVFFLLWRMIVLSKQSNSMLKLTGNNLILVASLAPLFLQQSYSITADTIIIIASLSFINLGLSRFKAKSIDAVVALIACYEALISKPVYAPSFLAWAAVFVIRQLDVWTGIDPRETFKSRILRITKSQEFLFLIGIFAVCASVGLHFALLKKPKQITRIDGVQPLQQLHYVMENFFQAVKMLHDRTMTFVNEQLLGSATLGWFDFAPSISTVTTWQHLACAALIIESICLLLFFGLTPRGGLLNKPKIKSSLITLSSISIGGLGIYTSAICITFSMYLFWTPVGAATIEGVQPRYFLPLFLMFCGLPRACAPIQQSESQAMRLNFSPRAKNISMLISLIFLVIFGANIIFYAFSLTLDTLKRYY